MAERRMFAKTIINSDVFLEMPTSAQCLYFHLGMRADDDGVVNNPKSIMRLIGAKDDDMRLLITKKFVIEMEDSLIVIKHWRINNYIQNDRYTPTKYQEAIQKLELDQNNAYKLPCIQGVYKMDTECIQDGYTGKVSKGKYSKDKGSLKKEKENKKEKDIYDLVENFFARPLSQLEYDIINGWINKQYTYQEIKTAIELIKQSPNRSIRYLDTILFEEHKKDEEKKADLDETIELSKIDWLRG